MKISKLKSTLINFQNPLIKTIINDEEKEIQNISKSLIKRMEEEKIKLNEIPFIKDSNTLKLLLYSIHKKNKLEHDILFISHYLTSFKSIINLINEKKTLIDSTKILNELSNNIKIEKKINKSIICRYGDLGDKFYLILQGSISVIVKKEIQIEMTEYEYYLYLKNLKKYSENELIEDNLKANKFHYDNIKMKNFIENEIEYKIPREEKQINYPEIDKEQLKYCNCENYINRILPIVNNENDLIKKKKLSLFIYYHVIDLKEGNTFGDIALSGNFKRTATIICNEDCIFGTLKKKTYDNCIKVTFEKIRSSNINFLINCDLFKGVKYEVFMKKYYNYFTIIHFKQGNFLFKQNEKRNEIYIIKNGLVEINIKSTYRDLVKIINLKNYNLNVEDEIIQLKKKNLTFGNLLTKSKLFKIIKLGKNEILGLNDYINNDELFYCNAICKSNILEVFSINYKIFTNICDTDFTINENLNLYNIKRNNKIFERINLMRSNYLNKDIDNIQRDLNDFSKEFDEKKDLMKINKNKVLLNTVYKPNKFSKLFKKINYRNNNIKFRHLNNHIHNRTDSSNEKNKTNINYFSSDENSVSKNITLRENTFKLIKSKIQKKKKIKSLNSLSITDNFSLIKINENKNNVNKEMTKKRILIPIKPLLKNDKSFKTLKEFKMNIISTTTFIQNQNKEKKIIDKIFYNALHNQSQSLSETKRFQKKESSFIRQVDFLILDKAMENYSSKKNKNIFLNKTNRLYKNKNPLYNNNSD